MKTTASLQFRLPLLSLALSVPILIVMALFLISMAEAHLRREEREQLLLTKDILHENTSTWLRLHRMALADLAGYEDIVSMNPARQKASLVSMARAFPHMYLVSTTDMKGMNVCRNDTEAPKDYTDRRWYQEAAAGKSIVYQSLIGKTSHQPALVLSMPIRDDADSIIGVAMFASNLTGLADHVTRAASGRSGQAFVVDEQNRVIFHSDPLFFTSELHDFSQDGLIKNLRAGAQGYRSYTDAEGVKWKAAVGQLENGWGIVVRETEEEFLEGLMKFQRAAWAGAATAGLVLLITTWVLVRRSLKPIDALTRTVSSVADGHFDLKAPVEGRNEVAVLGNAFNLMTERIRDLIENLMHRIREKDEAQAKASESERKLADIIEFLPDATMVLDVDGRIIAWNKAMVEMTGVPSDRMLGRGNYEHALPFYGERRPGLANFILRPDPALKQRYAFVETQSEERLVAETFPLALQGRQVILAVTAAPLRNSKGEIVGAVQSLRDITKQKNAESERSALIHELEARNAEMARFNYTVSHDLKTPLITMSNFLDLLEADLPAEARTKTATRIERIRSAVNRMLKRLQDVLRLAAAGKVIAGKTDVDMNKLVKEVLEHLDGIVAGRKIEFRFTADLPFAYGDAERLSEVWQNLLENAVKHMGETPEPLVEIGGETGRAENSYYVKDNGPGVDPSHQEKIFGLFERLSTKVDGTGVGLTLARRIVELHGGRLWVESEGGGTGCAFRFTLPRKK